MYLLRLYHRSDPNVPVAAHMLHEGTTVVGRDPAADWTIADPGCEISRRHLEFSFADGAVTMRPLGSNGVFCGTSREQLALGVEVPVSIGDVVEFGQYRMVADSVPFATRSGASFEGTSVFAAPFGPAHRVPVQWQDGGVDTPAYEEGSLLEAFCEGAGLDVSPLSGEDPAEIMHRAGAIYRQMLLGLGDLVSERSNARANLSLERTTISADGNNPVKWAPTRRLATDLLLDEKNGFLDGPEAIRSAFEDVKQHVAGTHGGFAAAFRTALSLLSPGVVEQRAEEQSSLLRGRSALCWAEFEKIYGEVEAQWLSGREGQIRAAFVEAYNATAPEAMNSDGSQPERPSGSSHFNRL